MKNVKTLIPILLLGIVGIVTWLSFQGLANSYHYINYDVKDSYLAKDDKIVIPSNIVYLGVFEDIIYGIQTPLHYYECDQGGAYKRSSSGINRYFMIDSSTDEKLFFDSFETFKTKLRTFGIVLPIKSNDLNSYPNYYNSIDDTCVDITDIQNQST